MASMRAIAPGRRGVYSADERLTSENRPGFAGAAVVSETISCVSSGAAGTQKRRKLGLGCGLIVRRLRFPGRLARNRA